MKRAMAVGLAVAVVAVVLAMFAPLMAQETRKDAAKDPAKETVTVERGVVFGKVGTRELQLDVAVPKTGTGPFPCVVFLYGGGWQVGSRKDMNAFMEGVAKIGYVGVAAEYRLVPGAVFPAQVEDCKAAVRWVRANAAKYRVNPEKIGVVGFSAGGHLASMLGVTGKEDGMEGDAGNADQSSKVQAVVNVFGPTDFCARNWDKKLETSVIVPFLGGTFEEKGETYKKASPITYVKKDSPAFLFIHGTTDAIVPVDQSTRMAEKLKEAGVDAKVVIYPGEGHGFSGAKNIEALKEMVAFLDARLK